MVNVEGNIEQRRETGASLMFIGLALWVAGLLVLFFQPAADRSGQQGTFHAIIALLVFAGAVLMALGWWMRRGSTTE